MHIHVARNAAQLGIFSAEEIVAGLQAGRFVATDLAWREGMPTWTTLGDWTEFQHSRVPAPPGVAATAVPVVSLIPWEQGKSLGSFFATVKVVVLNPAILTTGRFAFGDWLVFCYVALALVLPFQLVNLIGYGDKNAALAELLGRFNIPALDKALEPFAQTEPAPVWLILISAVSGLAFAPLLYALFGLFHWVGQRIFRLPIPLERTVAANLLVAAVLVLLMAPLQLLGFSFLLQMGVTMLAFIPACFLYYRALGTATGVNPWVQFGISSFIWFVLCGCCCLGPLGLLAATLNGKL